MDIFWNGKSLSMDGNCLSLENAYSCSDLEWSELWKMNDGIDGLTIIDEPCFMNGGIFPNEKISHILYIYIIVHALKLQKY
jgi:hypothetical protein